jgi:hypothetical protein
MSDYVKLATGAGDQFLAALAESQETFLKSVSAFSSWTPVPQPVATPAAFQAFTAELPTPKEVTEASFAFATKLLKQQKEFAEKFLTATTVAK